MSLPGAEQLIHTGCWRAAAHGAVRSFRAVALNENVSAGVCSRRVLPPSYLANQSICIAGQNP